MFPDIKNPKDFLTSRCVLQTMFKKIVRHGKTTEWGIRIYAW